MTITDEPITDAVYIAPDSDTDEQAPVEGSVYISDDAPSEGPQEKTPKKHKGPRKSANQLITIGWKLLGTAVEKRVDMPAGRCMQFQAPIAGKQLDDAIKDTWVDSLLQPFVKSADAAEGIGSLVALPIMLALYNRNEALGPLFEPILVELVRETLIDLAPVIKARQREEKRAAASLADVHEALNIDKDTDPILAVLNSFFAPSPTATEQEVPD